MNAKGVPRGWGRVGVRSRGRGGNFVHDDDFRALRKQVETLQEEIRRGFARMRDPVSDEEEEILENASQTTEQREAVAVVANDPLVIALSRIGKRPKIDVPTFSGNFNPEE
ncbi:hypothetical protein SUGI_0518050 [Cryptomeria japonica]|nr:hypothetical protein SUGI_0518050 [Cryptomeria japonica]